MHLIVRRFLSSLALVAWLGGPGVVHADVAGPARVIDGDTLAIGDERIRLRGIDAPERWQVCDSRGTPYPCGTLAAAWLVQATDGRTVRCEGDERDRYGRLLAVCYVGPVNLNAALVDAGWALAYRRYSKAFVTHEEGAREARRGLWSGRFEAPWAWRQQQQPSGLAEAGGDDCPVKGNVNRAGERIYHVPGNRHYARLRLDPHEGDRCFEDETAAAAAGFRPARR